MTIEYELGDIDEVAATILERYRDERVFLFHGQLGAGKTTFIKSLCKKLGIPEGVNSPTFGLVNEYQGDQSKVFHFDFYRVENPQEALDMGLDEYFESDEYCFVEWPEKVEEYLPESFVVVRIKSQGDQQRFLEAEKIWD